jgi:hypothetical protein
VGFYRSVCSTTNFKNTARISAPCLTKCTALCSTPTIRDSPRLRRTYNTILPLTSLYHTNEVEEGNSSHSKPAHDSRTIIFRLDGDYSTKSLRVIFCRYNSSKASELTSHFQNTNFNFPPNNNTRNNYNTYYDGNTVELATLKFPSLQIPNNCKRVTFMKPAPKLHSADFATRTVMKLFVIKRL